jgi:hypothetical protein
VCLDQTQTEAIEIYLLCQWAVGENFFLTDDAEVFILTDEGDQIIVNL